MMRYGIAVLAVATAIAWGEENQGISSTIAEIVGTEVQQEVNTPTSLEVIEIFRAETPEELDAALTDGYPMPWLAEILEDESIPEEDRYWLDCRMRAAIARDLSIFYNHEGNPVHIECDYMHPGEDYWREHFIVNPPGDSYYYDSPELPTRITDQPGYIVNLYGEKIGDIALTRCRVWLSRDASVGVGISNIISNRAESACFLYPDGSFLEREIDGVFAQYALSEDGSIAVYYAMNKHNPDSRERMLYAFDCNGDLIFQRLMPTSPISGGATPAISPDDRYIALPMYGGEVWLLDACTGETLHSWGGRDISTLESWGAGHYLTFSQNSCYLCISGGIAAVFDCFSGEEVLRVSRNLGHLHGEPPVMDENLIHGRTDNGASLLSCVRRMRLHGGIEMPISRTSFQSEVHTGSGSESLTFDDYNPYPSPNGIFLLIDHYDAHYFGGEGDMATATPLSVMILSSHCIGDAAVERSGGISCKHDNRSNWCSLRD